MSIIEKEYTSINLKEKEFPCFYSEVNVSILDIVAGNEVEVNSKDYKECLCKSSVNLSEYFKECDKCKGKGTILINKRTFTCNKCKGEKVIRTRDCYLCNNNSKILMDSKVKIKLEKTYKDGDKVELLFSDYKLVLTLKVYDKDDYYFKDDDVYYLRTINYSVSDHKEKKSVVINTIKGKEFVKSEFKRKKEIVCLKNKGINDGDFYFTFINEVKEEYKTIYTNVIIKENGYVNLDELISKNNVEAIKYVALDSNNYVYVDESVNEIICGEYLVKLNKLSKDIYYLENDNVTSDIYLEKEDVGSDRKSIYLDEEKLTIAYKKNLKEVELVEIFSKSTLDKQGKKAKLTIKVNPYFDNIYRIKIKNNKDIVYVEDYKRSDNVLVDTFKSNKYLEDYIKINKEERIVVGNDLLLIERV